MLSVQVTLRVLLLRGSRPATFINKNELCNSQANEDVNNIQIVTEPEHLDLRNFQAVKHSARQTTTKCHVPGLKIPGLD